MGYSSVLTSCMLACMNTVVKGVDFHGSGASEPRLRDQQSDEEAQQSDLEPIDSEEHMECLMLDAGVPTPPTPPPGGGHGHRSTCLDRDAMLRAKVVEKPHPFSGTEEKWRQWRFQFLNWMSIVEPNVVPMMEFAETMADVVPAQTGDMLLLGNAVYAILASMMQDKMLQLVTAVPARNGFEAWRQISREMEPR